MIYNGDTPSLANLIRAGISDVQSGQFTALPGKIKSYDKGTQCASAEPLVRAFDGAGNDLPLPPIVCMPVMFPGGTGEGGPVSIKYALSAGDPCLIVFSSVSIAQWVQGGEENATPESPRRSSLSDGIVIPGVRSFSAPLEPLPDGVDLAMGRDDGTSTITFEATGDVQIEAPTEIRLGAGAVDFVALAMKVETELANIKTALETHTHTLVQPGVGSSGVALPSYTPGSVGASKTKAE